jgi:hypothetical protein
LVITNLTIDQRQDVVNSQPLQQAGCNTLVAAMFKQAEHDLSEQQHDRDLLEQQQQQALPDQVWEPVSNYATDDDSGFLFSQVFQDDLLYQLFEYDPQSEGIHDMNQFCPEHDCVPHTTTTTTTTTTTQDDEQFDYQSSGYESFDDLQ